MIHNNRLFLTDSYKHSHGPQLPSGTTKMEANIEARGGIYPEILHVGLQATLKEYFVKPLTKDEVDEAKWLTELHGEPFNSEWYDVLEKFDGKFNLEILSVPEGTVVPTKHVTTKIRNTKELFPWMPGFFETPLLRGAWYMSEVATTSYRIKKLILGYLETTGDPSLIDFKLHDFGARGASSRETAALGGLGHLFSFRGTDTMSSLVAAIELYNAKGPVGFSIPAAEHSTITSWGRENEAAAYENIIRKFSGVGKIYACVSDSYNIFNATKNIWGGSLKSLVLSSGGTLVVRPDSGEPIATVLKVIQLLDETFGSTKNSKGFKVLNPAVRVIQGDGVDELSIDMILLSLMSHGYSADNIAFGMGGALLQAHTRDDNSWAMKCSAAKINGEWKDVYKDPITDSKKTSKKGRQELVMTSGKYRTIRVDEVDPNNDRLILRPVYRDGVLLIDEDFETIRSRIV